MQAIVRGLPFGVFLLVLAFPLAMAAVAFYAGFHARRRAALLKSMPTSNIGMAAEGDVERLEEEWLRARGVLLGLAGAAS